LFKCRETGWGAQKGSDELTFLKREGRGRLRGCEVAEDERSIQTAEGEHGDIRAGGFRGGSGSGNGSWSIQKSRRKKEAAAISPGKANARQNFYCEGNKYADDERAGI